MRLRGSEVGASKVLVVREQYPPAEDVDCLYPICQDVCGESSSSELKKDSARSDWQSGSFVVGSDC